MNFCANTIKKEGKILNYYPSKCEIYSILLKKRIINKIYTTTKKDKLLKKLAKIKLFEAMRSPVFLQPTDLSAFFENLFLRAEAVCETKGKKVTLKVTGQGAFLIDRRCFTYLILELVARGNRAEVSIMQNGLIIKGDFVCPSLQSLVKKLGGIMLPDRAGIPLKAANKSKFAESYNVLESLENEFSPEYLWL